MPNPKLETYKNKATDTVYDLTDADAQGKLTAILDGTDIDSFGDVETALADKMPYYYLEDNISVSIDTQTGHESLHTMTTNTITNSYAAIPSNKAVYDNTKDVYAANGLLGVKNINGTKYEEKTNNGVVWSFINGVLDAYTPATAISNSMNSFNGFDALFDGQVILSGVNSGTTDIHIYPFDLTDQAMPYKDSTKTERIDSLDDVYYGNEISFWMEKGHSYCMVCRVLSGATANHVKFYPMLRLATDTDSTYQPYAMTNRELTENNALKTLTITPASGITINDISYAKIKNGILNAYISFKDENNNITAFTDVATISGLSGSKDELFNFPGVNTGANSIVPCYCPFTKANGKIAIQTRTGITANQTVNVAITAILE